MSLSSRPKSAPIRTITRPGLISHLPSRLVATRRVQWIICWRSTAAIATGTTRPRVSSSSSSLTPRDRRTRIRSRDGVDCPRSCSPEAPNAKDARLAPTDRYRSPSDLPQPIAVFPLRGVILLPRAVLPFSIYEPRYLSMLEDILSGDRIVGIVQPDRSEGEEESPP